MTKANELEDIDRLKLELESWVEKKENEVAKLLQRPAKLRPGNLLRKIKGATSIGQSTNGRLTFNPWTVQPFWPKQHSAYPCLADGNFQQI